MKKNFRIFFLRLKLIHFFRNNENILRKYSKYFNNIFKNIIISFTYIRAKSQINLKNLFVCLYTYNDDFLYLIKMILYYF